MCEVLKVKDRRIEKYLQPLENPYIEASLNITNEGNGLKVNYSLIPDTSETFLSELGIAFLLDERIDRVQWIGQGPLPSYPGRDKANRYGFWAKQMDDLYFEGNRMGVDAAFFSDEEGNGLLVVGDDLNLNFEQTDRGIVLSVNAAVSGQGPKSSVTDYPVIAKNVGDVGGTFHLYRIGKEQFSQLQHTLFIPPSETPQPLHPFLTQYDTYLMHFDDISQ